MSSDQSSRFIAIVDDDQSVQCALQDLIESEGLSTLCFGSAEQFLDSGAQHTAGCLIADIRMPGMSGIELQAKLKDHPLRKATVQALEQFKAADKSYRITTSARSSARDRPESR